MSTTAANGPIVLYVDDEATALKYFPRMFPEFRTMTASGPTEARKIIEEHGNEIGVVISDQRMPDGSGTDLLSWVHDRKPRIVRILTTAYSDLDSAIAAVNTGAVYRYVVKPWDVADLKQTLLRGRELYELALERDRLLSEKLTVLQRMIVADRVRSYAVLAAGLANRIKNPMSALKAFLDCVPPAAPADAEPSQVRWTDLWNMAQRESQRVLDTVSRVAERVVQPMPTFSQVDLAQIATDALAPFRTKLGLHGGRLDLQLPAGGALMTGDAGMLKRQIEILADRMLATDSTTPGITVSISDGEVWSLPAWRVSLISKGQPWTGGQLKEAFTLRSPLAGAASEFEPDLLAAYFIAYHHSGTMAIHRQPPNGPGFSTILPKSPDAATVPGVDPEWTERIFTWFDN